MPHSRLDPSASAQFLARQRHLAGIEMSQIEARDTFNRHTVRDIDADTVEDDLHKTVRKPRF